MATVKNEQVQLSTLHFWDHRENFAVTRGPLGPWVTVAATGSEIKSSWASVWDATGVKRGMVDNWGGARGIQVCISD